MNDAEKEQKLMQQLSELQSAIHQRDEQIKVHQQTAEISLRAWEQAVGKYVHLACTPEDLRQYRRQVRKSLLPLPEMKAAQWNFVVALGPAGVGKSSFVKRQLMQWGKHGE
jgi:GTP1/Obg family GTP-binding protein